MRLCSGVHAEVRQHAAGAMAVADPGVEGNGRLVGVERAGLVSGPRLSEAQPVQRQGLAVCVVEPAVDRERLLAELERFAVALLRAQDRRPFVQPHRIVAARLGRRWHAFGGELPPA